LPEFFINFLTEPGDTVLDIFAGSNTTGAAAEVSRRNWIAFEENKSYLAASAFRFMDVNQNVDEYLNIFQEIINTGNNIKITSNFS
jgi:site-specific DNA-methyltransferase (cytosine-N4-specific)